MRGALSIVLALVLGACQESSDPSPSLPVDSGIVSMRMDLGFVPDQGFADAQAVPPDSGIITDSGLVLDSGELSDAGSSMNDDAAVSLPDAGPSAVCGDKRLEGQETCDDGNLDNDDGCSSSDSRKSSLFSRNEILSPYCSFASSKILSPSSS